MIEGQPKITKMSDIEMYRLLHEPQTDAKRIEELTKRLDEAEALILFINDRLNSLIDVLPYPYEDIKQQVERRMKINKSKAKGENNA